MLTAHTLIACPAFSCTARIAAELLPGETFHNPSDALELPELEP